MNASWVFVSLPRRHRDGKPRYLSFLPRMWDLLERDLAHPALEPVAQWFAANIPADQRHRALVEFAPA